MTSSPNRRSRVLHPAVIEQLSKSVSSRLGVELRPCQIVAATELLSRVIVEMQTGEGKTLTTALAAADLAHGRRRVLVVTANDYLAKRDAQWMSGLYDDLQLRVGCVASDSTSTERVDAYAADITYGTLREFAFDYLKQSLAHRQTGVSGPTLDFAFDVMIVDEADSVLIDEARTPLVITAASGNISAAADACYRWSASLVKDFHLNVDYVRLAEGGAIALTQAGRHRILHAEMPAAMGPLSTTEIQHAVERAIWVDAAIQRDVHYVVDAGRIQLVDEYTGRKSAQRNFGGGIHQAIEARENLPLTPESQPAARITVQDFVSKFSHLCGITATAWEDRQELHNVYELVVRRVATHAPSQRVVLPPVVSRSTEEKYERIAADTLRWITSGRAVLIGTRTISQSERLSEHFYSIGIEHSVLSARNPEREAGIVAEAGGLIPSGGLGRVTIATNMAGRGTDIRLDPRVAEAGGLHVIVSQPHVASRIDRQLFGRCGRQGDPGTAQLHCSPEDEILEQAFGAERAQRIRDRAVAGASDRWILSQISRAQTVVAYQHREARARLTAHEAATTASLSSLGLDPHLDPLPTPFA